VQVANNLSNDLRKVAQQNGLTVDPRTPTLLDIGFDAVM
jgi:hypothetical protein